MLYDRIWNKRILAVCCLLVYKYTFGIVLLNLRGMVENAWF